MARSKRTSSGSKRPTSGGFKPAQFIDVPIDSDGARELQALVEADEFPLELQISLQSDGYRISAGKDKRSDGYRCSLIRDSEGDTYMLSGWGSTPINAWFALAYKHFVLLGGEWENAKPVASSGDFG